MGDISARDDRKHQGRLAASIALLLGRCSGPSPVDSVDVGDAIGRLKAALSAIPNVLTEPAPTVEIVDFSPMGPVLAVRPHCHTDHYWQVYFDTNRAIVGTFGAAGYPVPEQHFRVAAP